jgi:hypothetical protein
MSATEPDVLVEDSRPQDGLQRYAPVHATMPTGRE